MELHLTASGCHLPYGITCYPTQVNTPHLNSNQTGQYSIYLPRRDGDWLHTKMVQDGLPAHRQLSPIQVKY